MPPFEALDQGVVPPAISPHVDGCPTLPHTVDVSVSSLFVLLCLDHVLALTEN